MNVLIFITALYSVTFCKVTKKSSSEVAHENHAHTQTNTVKDEHKDHSNCPEGACPAPRVKVSVKTCPKERIRKLKKYGSEKIPVFETAKECDKAYWDKNYLSQIMLLSGATVCVDKVEDIDTPGGSPVANCKHIVAESNSGYVIFHNLTFID